MKAPIILSIVSLWPLICLSESIGHRIALTGYKSSQAILSLQSLSLLICKFID